MSRVSLERQEEMSLQYHTSSFYKFVFAELLQLLKMLRNSEGPHITLTLEVCSCVMKTALKDCLPYAMIIIFGLKDIFQSLIIGMIHCISKIDISLLSY